MSEQVDSTNLPDGNNVSRWNLCTFETARYRLPSRACQFSSPQFSLCNAKENAKNRRSIQIVALRKFFLGTYPRARFQSFPLVKSRVVEPVTCPQIHAQIHIILEKYTEKKKAKNHPVMEVAPRL